MNKYYNQWKKLDFKKRFLTSTIFLFLCGFVPNFVFFIFLLITSNFEVYSNMLGYFYYSLFFGFIGIFIALFYSFTYKYRLATALVILFIFINLLYLIRYLLGILVIFIVGMGIQG